MRKPMAILLAASVAVGGVMSSIAPASASMSGVVPAAIGKSVEPTAPTAEFVRYRGSRRYYRSGRSHRRHYYTHRHRRDRGSAAAAGIIGFAAGAILGSALSNQGSNWHAYCASKYRSYDARTGTFMGYDGRRHPCR